MAQFTNPSAYLNAAGSSVELRSRDFYGGLDQIIANGTPVNMRNLSQCSRKTIEKNMEEGSMSPDRISWYYAPTPIIDDLVAKCLTGRPVIEDAFNHPNEVVEDYAQMEQAFAKALGASNLHVLGTDKTDEFNKTLTANNHMIHAVADYDVGILYKRAYPLQASLPTEANIGKDIMYDMIPPYALGSAFMGGELPPIVESDFESFTTKDHIRYMWSFGRITDQAIRFGASAYPTRDFRSYATDTHIDAMRSLREREILGVDTNVTSAQFTYRNAGPDDYKGISQRIAEAAGNADNTLKSIVSGADVSTAEKPGYALDKHINDVAIKMNVAGILPNLALADMNSFATLRETFIRQQFQAVPNAAAMFGITSMSLSLQGMSPINIVAHPFLPRTSGQSAVYMLDTNLLPMRVAWRDTIEVLAKVDNTYRFMISAAETLFDKTSRGDGDSALGPGWTLHGAVTGITHSQAV